MPPRTRKTAAAAQEPKANGASTVTPTGLEPVSNGGEAAIVMGAPYSVAFTLEGTSVMLFHRWLVESVEAKEKASKGSAAKKTDDVESYVWRAPANGNGGLGEICLPGEYVRQSIIHAAKYKQDPRSARKSAMDLFKAAIISDTELASLGTNQWDYLDQRRVKVNYAGITRRRPAFAAGWTAAFVMTVLLPEYVNHQLLLNVLTDAGRLVGVADYRPSYGRFAVTKYEVLR